MISDVIATRRDVTWELERCLMAFIGPPFSKSRMKSFIAGSLSNCDENCVDRVLIVAGWRRPTGAAGDESHRGSTAAADKDESPGYADAPLADGNMETETAIRDARLTDSGENERAGASNAAAKRYATRDFDADVPEDGVRVRVCLVTMSGACDGGSPVDGIGATHGRRVKKMRTAESDLLKYRRGETYFKRKGTSVLQGSTNFSGDHPVMYIAL